MPKVVSDQIDVETDITIDVVTNVKLEVNIDMDLKPILNESVEDSIHFLPIVEKVLTEEVDEFYSVSFDKGNKARVTKTSCDIEGRKFEVIIPRKKFGVGSDSVPNGS